MRKITSAQAAEILLFALPCFWTLVLLFIVLVPWRGRITSDLIHVILVSITIAAAAVFLAKKRDYRICFPLLALGANIALMDDPFMGRIYQFFGVYLVLHYLACGVYVYRSRKSDAAAGHGERKASTAIGFITIGFALSLLWL